MEESDYTNEILKKYTTSSSPNYFMSVTHQRLPDRLASLKAHVFSGNANSLPTSGSEQTNCFMSSKIYSSHGVTPPSNISLASRGNSKYGGVYNAGAFNTVSLKQEEKTELQATLNSKLCEENTHLDFKNLEYGSDVDQNNSSSVGNATNATSKVDNDVASVKNCVRRKPPLERKITPIVVVTPASEQTLDSPDMDSKIGTSNGDVDGVYGLNDCIDSCSLSSVCSEDQKSEDDILTDDDPSESDSASQVEENVEKVSQFVFFLCFLVFQKYGGIIRYLRVVRCVVHLLLPLAVLHLIVGDRMPISCIYNPTDIKRHDIPKIIFS